jgi:ATP-dependent Clp protease, protease subunit
VMHGREKSDVLHHPSGFVAGTASDMRAMAEALDRMKAGMVAAYGDKSGRDDAEIEALMRDETWLSAQEAVDLGLADRVEEPVRIAARFDLSRFRNPPPQLATLVATTTRRRITCLIPRSGPRSRSRTPSPLGRTVPHRNPSRSRANQAAPGPSQIRGPPPR